MFVFIEYLLSIFFQFENKNFDFLKWVRNVHGFVPSTVRRVA